MEASGSRRLDGAARTFALGGLIALFAGCAGPLPAGPSPLPEAGDAGILDGGATDSGATDGGPADAGTDGGAGPALGTIESPILIDAGTLPAWFVDTGDTRSSTSRALASYPPLTQLESGPEVVYRFTLQEPAKISLTLESAAGAHLDAALLTAVSPHPLLWKGAASSFSDARIDNSIGRNLHYRADGTLDPGSQLDPGTYYIVVDSLDDSRAGAYVLRVKLALMPNLCTASTTPAPNGTPREVDHHNGCPPGMLRIAGAPDTCVDKFEAMLVGLDAQGQPFPWSPYLNPGKQRIRALSVESVIPQAYMDKYQSAAACAEAGKRLCTYKEWLRACRGSEGRTYPYGNTRDQNIDPRHPPADWDPERDACDDARTVHSAVEYFAYFGLGGNYVWSHLTHPCIDQVPQGLDPTGWRPRCATQEGAHDMMGNVHEWIDERDVWEASGHTRTVPAGHGAFAGGYYLDTWLNGDGCSYLTTAHTPDQIDASTGFRCCADAK